MKSYRDKAQDMLSDWMATIMAGCGKIAEANCKELCPVDTGRRRNSITDEVSEDGKSVIVGTNDGRERPSHVMCNNTYANPRTGKFLNGLRFPGDPNGEPSEIWNCRCTLVEEVMKDEELQ